MMNYSLCKGDLEWKPHVCTPDLIPRHFYPDILNRNRGGPPVMVWRYKKCCCYRSYLHDKIIEYFIRYTGMKFSILIVSLVLAVAFVLTAGCTQNATPPVTATPTASPVSTSVRPDNGTCSDHTTGWNGHTRTHGNAPGGLFS